VPGKSTLQPIRQAYLTGGAGVPLRSYSRCMDPPRSGFELELLLFERIISILKTKPADSEFYDHIISPRRFYSDIETCLAVTSTSTKVPLVTKSELNPGRESHH
jgi:hypothetical protein